MSAPFRLWENAQVVSLLTPAVESASVARVSNYIDMKNVIKGYLVCMCNGGSATPVQWQPLQATDNTGATNKAIGVAPIAFDAAVGTTTTTDTLSLATAAATYTTDTGTNAKITIFEIAPESCMDVNASTPFTHLAISTNSAGSATANLTSVLFIGLPVRNALFPPQTVAT